MAFDLSSAKRTSFDLASAKPVSEAPEKERTLGGLGMNFMRNVGEMYSGLAQLPDLIPTLPGAAYSALEEAYGLHPGAKERAVERAQGATQAVKTAMSHPEQIPGQIADWAYEHPADVAAMLAGPAAKGATAVGAGLRAAEAAKIAEGSLGAARALGVTAKAAETAGKVLPYTNPMLPGEKLLIRPVVNVGRNLFRGARNIVDPTTAEIRRMLGPTMSEVRESLVTPEARLGESELFTGERAAPGVRRPAGIPEVKRPEIATDVAPEGVYPPGITPGGVPAVAPEEAIGAAKAPQTRVKGTAPVSGYEEPPTGGSGFAMGPSAPYGYGGEDVFGQFRTAGEKAAGAGVGGKILAAMQNVIHGATEKSRRSYMDLALKRSNVRQNMVRETAAAQEDIDRLSDAVSKAGDLPYDAARNLDRAIDLQPVEATIQDLIKRNPKNRKLIESLNSIRRNIYDIGTGELESSSAAAASIIDDLKGMIGDRNNAFIKKSLVKVKDALYNQFPEYAAADAAYRNMWAPLHRKQIGLYLSDILEKKGPEAYQAALANQAKTIKAATGQTLFNNLDAVFEGAEDDLGKLRTVGDDIASEASYLSAANDKDAHELAKTIYRPENINLPDLWNPQATMVKWILKNTQGQWTLKEAEKFATDMLNPATAKTALDKAIKKERRSQVINRWLELGISGGATPEAGLVGSGIHALGAKYQVPDSEDVSAIAPQYDVPAQTFMVGEEPQQPVNPTLYENVDEMGEDYGVLPQQ